MSFLVFGAVGGVLCFGEHMNKPKVIAIILTFLGGFIVCTSIFYYANHTNNSDTNVYRNVSIITKDNIHSRKQYMYNDENIMTSYQSNISSNTSHKFIQTQAVQNQSTTNEPKINMQMEHYHQNTTNSDIFVPDHNLVINCLFGTLLSTASAICEVLSMSAAKQLNNSNMHFAEITFWTSLIQVPFSLILMACFENVKLILGLKDILFTSLHTIFCAFMIATYFISISYGEVILVSIVITSDIPMRVFFQFVGFSDIQAVQTGWWDIMGAILVTIGVLVLPCWELSEKDSLDQEVNETKSLVQHHHYDN